MVTTTDLYEASYYLLNGCNINCIACLPVNGKDLSQFTFIGEQLPELQLKYFQGEAEVNLIKFRRTYAQVNAFSYDARKKWRQQQKAGGDA